MPTHPSSPQVLSLDVKSAFTYQSASVRSDPGGSRGQDKIQKYGVAKLDANLRNRMTAFECP